jgi:hypothetical protein
MAIQTRLIDDLDASTDGIASYRFGLEGADYTIDLSPANVDTLRGVLAPFIAAGRRVTTPPAARPKPAKTSGVSHAVIRAWWTGNADRLGLPTPNAHGRIPAAVETAYRNAH